MSETDIQGAVARVREKRGPKHSPEQRAKWREDKRKGKGKGEPSSKRAKRDSEPEPEREPYVPDEGSIRLCSMLATQLWDLSRIASKRRGLEAGEARKLGETMDPLLHKYLPALSGWAEEVAFVIAVASIWQATAPPPEDDGKDTSAPGADDVKAEGSSLVQFQNG